MKKIIKNLSRLRMLVSDKVRPKGIQMTIAISFTLMAVISMTVLGTTLYGQFANRTESMNQESTKRLLNQTAINLEDYLRNMRRISDAMYYSAIKDKDFSVDTMDEEMNLLYEANKDNLISVECYTKDGKLISSAPVSTQKKDVDVRGQEWFKNALGQIENLHFSTPHVQNLFDDPTYRYYWVLSLSRTVELNTKGESSLGVLLVDMNYSSVEQILEKANKDNSLEYMYLMDGKGEIIYHPKQKLIYNQLFFENNKKAVDYEDGYHEEVFEKEKREVTVKSISYTGWKLISVSPKTSFQLTLSNTKYFVIMLVTLALLANILLNQLISARIAKPLNRLNDSIKDWEAGNLKPDIYVGGTLEVEHLGKTLRSTVGQIRQLMNDVFLQQEEKRKSELEALQSQINPHFLYNTLDSIVWMIEGEHYDDAVYMITELASLFRISLSKGKTIISIEDEIKHAKNYMNIQKKRYKDKFCVSFLVDEEILQCITVKLILQPLLENAIYYGVGEEEEESEIVVRGYRKEDKIYLEVEDSGRGIMPSLLPHLLEDTEKKDKGIQKKGSGVGLVNVHNRIYLRFGTGYGLEIHSELDEGTLVRVCLPCISYESYQTKKAKDKKEKKGEGK
ncbi:MAG TPA: histidine kinase [Lachnospiraceae bacterium]